MRDAIMSKNTIFLFKESFLQVKTTKIETFVFKEIITCFCRSYHTFEIFFSTITDENWKFYVTWNKMYTSGNQMIK